MVEDGQRTDRGRTQHASARSGDGRTRRIGRRTSRLGRSWTLGHDLGFLPCHNPTRGGFRPATTRCGRWRAKPCCLSQEGNVQRSQESRSRPRRCRTCDADHRRKSSAARLASMDRFVSVFTPARHMGLDIAASCNCSEQWWRAELALRSALHLHSAPSDHALTPVPPTRKPEITRYHNPDVRKVGYRI